MDTTEKTLQLDGMSCGHCVAAVRKTLEHAGVTVKEVEIGSARIAYDPAAVRLEAVTAALEEEGYPARVAE